MSLSPSSTSLVAAVCLSGFATAAPQVPLDNVKDRSVHWNTHLVSPIVLSEDGSELFAINQGGQRLAIFDPLTMARLADVPLGPGLVAMAQRPGTGELWLVDKVASSVSVLDIPSRTVLKSIRVGAEPHGIAFTPSGDRAYVACSGVDRVDVLNASPLSIATSIDIPAKNPRAVVFHQGVAWVMPHLSGNNTAPMGASTTGAGVNDIREVRSLADFPSLNQLPDRDLLAISSQPNPAADHLDPSETRTGLGTMLMNLSHRPGTDELWIPHTEALNAVHKGEKNFVAGQVVRNRITIVDATGVLAPQVVDLDALAPEGSECSQPTGVAFDPVRPLAYVCAYGSDRVAVLDLSGGTPTWFGSIEVPFSGYPDFTNPRTCVVDAAGQWLYVLNKGNTSVSRYDLSQLPLTPGFAVTPPPPHSLGWDSVSGVERFGRNDLVNGNNSLSKKTSCASCHVDGHYDGLAWNLGGFHDPEGTPNSELSFPLDDKGPLVTQSVRRMFGSGPYHWRGEKQKLVKFNQAFINLMEREENGVPKNLGAHFHYLERYMRQVSYVPNPRQELDRSLTPKQASGAQIFMQKDVLNGASCADCHQLPLGTGGEIVPSHVRGKFGMADVPQLRGVVDKLTPPHFIGGRFGTRTELGAGLSHGGAFATVGDLLAAPHSPQTGQATFNLTPAEIDDLAAFLSAFDTGLAPSTGYLATANASNAATFAATELAYLTSEAAKGNCDLIYRASPTNFGPKVIWPSGLYDPQTGDFEVAQAGAPRVTIQTLMNDAAAGNPVTFIGVPVWMGLPMALDRDQDRLYDLDELVQGTHPELADTDGDAYPDGYELLHGNDPLTFETTTSDTTPPALVGPPTLIYKTTNTIKLEFETTEVCNVLVYANGGKAVQRLPLHQRFDFQFSLIVHELKPNKTYDIDLELVDPSDNTHTETVTFTTEPLYFPPPVVIDSIDLGLQRKRHLNPILVARVGLSAGGVSPTPGYAVTADVFHDDFKGTLTQVATGVQSTLNGPSGVVTFRVPLTYATYGLGGSVNTQPTRPFTTGQVFFVVRDIDAPAGQPHYAQPLNAETWDSVGWN